MLTRWWLFCSLWFLPLFTFSQQTDTTPTIYSSQIQYTTFDSAYQLHPIDTSLSGYHYYNPLNPDIKTQKNGQIQGGYAHLGNLGAAYQPLTIQLQPQLPLRVEEVPFLKYLKQPSDIKFFRTPVPFTQASYTLSINNEQKFNVMHTQNINERLNLGISYDRLRSKGVYRHQLADHQSISAFGWYQTPNQKYNLLLTGIWSKSNVQENGGLRNPSDVGEFEALPTRLELAEQRLVQKQIHLQQSWSDGYYQEKALTDTTTYRTFHPTYRFQHEAEFESYYGVYFNDFDNTSPDSAFYNNFYITPDTLPTHDSLRYNKIENKLTFHLLPRKAKNDTEHITRSHSLKTSIRHSLYHITQRDWTEEYRTIQQQNLTTQLHWQKTTTPKSRFLYEIKGRYSLIDHNKGDYFVKVGANYRWGKRDTSIETTSPPYKIKTGFNLLRNKFSPTWKEQRYYGNHHQWNKNFNATTLTQLQLYTHIPDWQTSLILQGNIIENFIYFDESAQPSQYEPSFRMAAVQLSKNFQWRHWHLDNTVILQQVEADSILHLPRLWSKHSFYYEGRFFNDVMKAQIGADLYLRSPYKINAYNPALRRFHLQHQQRYAHPPLVDVFFNFRVKKARVFAKASYANQYLLSNPYYFNVFHHPMPVPLISAKVGFTWNFYD